MEYICTESNNLHNCTVYLARQMYFKTGKILGRYDLQNALKNNIHFAALQSQSAQSVTASVAESLKSFQGLLKGIKKGTVTQLPNITDYRKAGGLNLIAYPSQAVKLNKGNL